MRNEQWVILRYFRYIDYLILHGVIIISFCGPAFFGGGVLFSVGITLGPGDTVFSGKIAFRNTIVEGAISEALFHTQLLPPILNVTQKSHTGFPGVAFPFGEWLFGRSYGMR